MGLELERCCELVDREISRLAEVTAGVDPTTPVPTCPDWTIADLLDHTGAIYRWAATMVRDSSPERLRRDDLDLQRPADPTDYPAWIADGAAFVRQQFRSCDPDTPMWAWGWPKNAGFWPRRMVHEVGIHRADAELAIGITPAFDPEVAADGIAELLDNLPHAEYFSPGVSELRGNGESIGLRDDQADVQWQIRLLPDRFEWVRQEAAEVEIDCDVVVSAPVTQLLLALYRRGDDVTVTGAAGVWERWKEKSAL